MRLRITNTNYTTAYDWLYKLIDESGNEYYIMDGSFYKKNNLQSPITKHELDYYSEGIWITANVKEINGKKIVCL